MKKFAILLTAALAMTLLLDSCSVQKRYHRKGFTVNWNNTSVKMKKNRQVIHSESIQEDIIVSDSKKTEKLKNKYEAPIKIDLANKNLNHPVAIDMLFNGPQNNIGEEKIESKKFNNAISNQNASSTKSMSKRTLKSTKKAVKKVIKSIKKNQQHDSKTDTIIYLLLILLVPFGTTIAMYLYEGSWTNRVTTNLLLTLLCGIPGLIHALVVIFGNN